MKTASALQFHILFFLLRGFLLLLIAALLLQELHFSVTECFGSGFFRASDCSGVRTLLTQ